MTPRIFRNSLLVGLTAVVLSVALFLGALYEYDEGQVYAQLAAAADYVARGVEQGGLSYLEGLDAGSRITWVAQDGTILYDSAADPAGMENHSGRTEIAEAMETGRGQSAHFSSTLLQKTLYSAKRLPDGSVVRVSANKSTITTLLLGMLQPVAWIVLLVLALSGLLASRLARRITKPINELDLDHPQRCRIYPELAPLTDRLALQSRTIRRQMDELSARQREFAAITESMSEGFLLLDSRRAVLASNRRAVQLAFSAAQPPARLEAVNCRAEVCACVDAALAGAHGARSFADDGCSYQVIANPVVADGQVTGAAVLIMDVTEREQRESLRREFSANVSHELKTPLTSISGFAELMKDGLVPPEKVPEFAGDIHAEAQRLISLIDDIIRLSALDEDAPGFEPESVDLHALAAEVLERLRPAAAGQGVTLRLQGAPLTVRGVRQILEEMVFNLCDNAIKYNVPDGSVTVSLRRPATGGACLEVADTGVGIPYAHQSRVFERFYRVDKSHSRQLGGTGLGLSIVKHAAQYHGARLELQSTPSKGTSIAVLFPESTVL
ncbi:MAG: ATP-binding protein [Clostridiales bacterium]|nr:ATP-binding protein [Clostridiales bacterium]